MTPKNQEGCLHQTDKNVVEVFISSVMGHTAKAEFLRLK